MSTEDVLAREDASNHVDMHTPMAFEVPAAPKRKRAPKLDARARASRAGYAKALKLANAENRRRISAEKKAATAESKRLQILADKQAKLDAAEGGRIALPAVVLRSGLVRTVTLVEVVEIIELFLDNLCLDCETSGYWIGHEHYELRTIQLGGEEMAVVLDADEEFQRDIASWALNAADKVWAHSTPADACPVIKAGLITWDNLWAKMYDSVIKAKLVDPKLCGSEADKLKDLAHDILREYAVSPQAEVAKDELFKVMKCKKRTDVLTPPEDNGWHQVSKFAVTMIRYAGSDVLDLAAVLRMLPPLPVSDDVMERERITQSMCAKAAYDGFPLDLGHIQGKISEAEASQSSAREFVEAATNGRIVNPSSSKDVLEYLIGLGPELYPLKVNRKTKQLSAGKDSLEPIANRGDKLAENIIRYRAEGTKLGLLLRPLENLCTHGDQIMRPTVYTINAKTGRMSCVRPNGQQFSRQGGIRACVRCWADWLGISADFAGCEIRVAAALSGDRGLYEAETSPYCYKCEVDTVIGGECSCGTKEDNGKLVVAGHTGLHWRTAHGAQGKGAQKEHRYQAKRGTFTRLFGGGPQTAADQVGCDIADMQKIFSSFDDQAPDFTAWDNWLRDCYDGGYYVWRDFRLGQNFCQKIEGDPGRHLIYKTYSGRNVYVTNGAHAAGNGAIQGTARELLVDGLVRWQKTRWGNLAVLPVHDQIIVMVPEGEAEAATAELARCMESDVLSSPGFDVHISVDTDTPFTSWPDSS